MDSNRLFIYGVVLLLLGVQFRLVESFELNEKATRVVERYFPSSGENATTTALTTDSSGSWPGASAASGGRTRHIRHAPEIAFSLISAGAVMILISPAYRK
jgi:hypothetical protein